MILYAARGSCGKNVNFFEELTPNARGNAEKDSVMNDKNYILILPILNSLMSLYNSHISKPGKHF